MPQVSLNHLVRQIQVSLSYEKDKREQQQIAFLLLEGLMGVNKSDLLLNKMVVWDEGKDIQLKAYIDRLNQAVPVQYVLGHAHFWGREFEVNPSVLIPRGETEELVQWIINTHQAKPAGNLLDIGCGSGCIALTLGLELQSWTAHACDVSPEAIQTTQRNATIHQCDINVFEIDILKNVPELNSLDLIVSNPPYIPQEEASTMKDKVVLNEPAEALFVPDDNPLIFYHRIVQIAPELLQPGGWLYFEIHHTQGSEVLELFNPDRWHQLELRTDLHGKNRMIRAQLI